MTTKTRQQFLTELARSRVYELAFSRWLQQERKFYTLPVFDFYGTGNGHAPSLEGKQRALTAPDILASNEDGIWSWFEIKLKDYAPIHRISQTRVTGMPLRHWQDYRAIRDITKSPVWIVFIHLKEREIVAEEIGRLSEHNIDHKATMDSGGTVFFQYNKLHRLMSLDKLENYREKIAM